MEGKKGHRDRRDYAEGAIRSPGFCLSQVSLEDFIMSHNLSSVGDQSFIQILLLADKLLLKKQSGSVWKRTLLLSFKG